MGWNGVIDRRPAAVAYPTDADDVAAAIRAAGDAGLAFTIRAGAHGRIATALGEVDDRLAPRR
ncbi:MAG: FAD-binding protein, partial [Thermoleophilaceae bacterium]